MIVKPDTQVTPMHIDNVDTLTTEHICHNCDQPIEPCPQHELCGAPFGAAWRHAETKSHMCDIQIAAKVAPEGNPLIPAIAHPEGYNGNH